MYDKKSRERHHRLPVSRGGTGVPKNISFVRKDYHRAWHLLVGNMNAKEVAKMLSDVWIDPGYYLVAVPRSKHAQRKRRKRRYCIDCECEVLKHIPRTDKRE